jgi:enoyl-CoA hydratase/carnithine racemase
MSTEEMIRERIRLRISDEGVADVRLFRADKMNALDSEMFHALIETGEKLCAMRQVRAVVLSGEGRAFCAGLDTSRFGQMAASADTPGAAKGSMGRDITFRTHGLANGAQQAVMIWTQVPVPVIAAVHGVAFGGGLQVALGADLRYVTPDARMCVMEIKWGLVPDMGGALLMRTLMRADVIRELTYTGRIVDGVEAQALGLATRVCADPYQVAMETALEMTRRNPEAMRAAKRLLTVADQGDPAAILLAESVEQARLIGSSNQAEAVRANLEKRLPTFADPQ